MHIFAFYAATLPIGFRLAFFTSKEKQRTKHSMIGVSAIATYSSTKEVYYVGYAVIKYFWTSTHYSIVKVGGAYVAIPFDPSGAKFSPVW